LPDSSNPVTAARLDRLFWTAFGGGKFIVVGKPPTKIGYLADN
jgi:hypothetical protein